jgi:hypothetical protein
VTRQGPRRTALRVGALACLTGAAVVWWAVPALATQKLGPTQTAWYDTTGAQQVTGETTPSPARPGELEVSWAPAQATVPQETVPSTPTVPGTPVAPPQGTEGGNTEGGTLAFAALEYQVPLGSGSQTVDPSSITGLLELTLDTTSSENVQSGDLLACPTATTLWSAGSDQDASQAPRYSCANDSVTGNVDSADHIVSFSLDSAQESTLQPGTFSVVIVPSTTPSGPFQAIFSAPGTDSFQVTGETSSSNVNLNLAGPPENTPPTQAPPSIGNVAPSAYAQTAASPSLNGSSQPNRSTTSPVGYSSSPVAVLRGGLGSNAQRTVALLVLLALGALLVGASSRQTHVPHSLRQASNRASPPSG